MGNRLSLTEFIHTALDYVTTRLSRSPIDPAPISAPLQRLAETPLVPPTNQDDHVSIEQQALLRNLVDQRNKTLPQPPKGPEVVAPTPRPRETTVERLRREAKHSMKIDSVNDYNFAFTGRSKVGKSSMINAILGLDDDHPQAAKVDFVESTMEPAAYRSPTLPHVVLWDMPGAGTIAHPQKTYFFDKRLYVFDCLVIVVDESVMESDLALAKTALKYKTPIVIVRNKSRNALKQELKRVEKMEGCKEANVKKVRRIVKQRLIEHLRVEMERFGLPSAREIPIFILDSLTIRDEKRRYKLHEAKFLKFVADDAHGRRNSSVFRMVSSTILGTPAKKVENGEAACAQSDTRDFKRAKEFFEEQQTIIAMKPPVASRVDHQGPRCLFDDKISKLC